MYMHHLNKHLSTTALGITSEIGTRATELLLLNTDSLECRTKYNTLAVRLIYFKIFSNSKITNRFAKYIKALKCFLLKKNTLPTLAFHLSDIMP